MGTRDPRFDAYIAKAGDFAKPILAHLRDTVHEACPDVEETMKWSAPYFMYHGMLCGMAAFKQHCAFGFWKGSLIVDGQGVEVEKGAGNFGRITAVADLPPKRELMGYIRKAMKLNIDSVPVPSRSTPRAKTGKEMVVPEALTAALRKNRKALATFEAFSPSHKREYVEWIAGAKREETRERRIATAVAQMAEGKSHNWKYERPKGQ